MKAPCKLEAITIILTFLFAPLYRNLTFKMESKKTINPYTYWILCAITAEIIEWFIEDQAFSPSYGLTPPPPPPFPARPAIHSKTEKERQLITDGRGGAGGRGRGGAKSHNCKKAWSSINRSIISDVIAQRIQYSQCSNKKYTFLLKAMH